MQNSLNQDYKPEKKNGAFIVIIILSLLVVILAMAFVWALTRNNSTEDGSEAAEKTAAADEKFSGSAVVYEPDVEDMSTVTEEQLEQVMTLMKERLDSQGVDGYKIGRRGRYGIEVKIPDVPDISDIVDFIGKTGALQFMNAYGEVAMEGDREHIKKARAVNSAADNIGSEGYFVELNFTDKGREAFKKATEEAVALISSDMNYIAICMDGVPYSMPSVREVIDADSCVISGSFTKEEAEELVGLINAGRMPFKLKGSDLVSVSE